MDRRYTMISAAALALLGGCGKGDEVTLTNASPREVAAKVGTEATKLEPGQWETKVTVSDITMPDMPAGVADQVKGAMKGAANTTVTSCITPEEAAHPQGKVFGGGEGQCRYKHFTMADGRIDAEMECAGGDRGGVNLKTSGSITPTSFTVDNAMVMTGEGTPKMSMKAKVAGRRIGACPG